VSVLDQFDLHGRTAIVTGANQGIGLAIAHALGDAGATIVVAARNETKSESAVAELADAGIDAWQFGVDLTDRAACEALVAAVVERAGRIDVLVNNAGACIHKPAIEVTEDDWSSVLDVNLTAVWRLSILVAPHMMAAGGGVMLNIGSMSAEIVNRPQWQPAYNASKAGVHHLTKSLAVEWAPEHIRVNALAPGYIETAMSPIHDPRYSPFWIDAAPQQRAGQPAELGAAALFLCSDASSFVTGSILTADGGYTAV
jgi:NAD(P)-dependent dehydrogenase (short-subunit alcohol dehydrogenase family)